MDISCVLSITDWYPGNRRFYCCNISKVDLSNDPAFTLKLIHINNKSDEDVEAIAMIESKIFKFPSHLSAIFKNVTVICVKQCNLDEISSDDIKNFHNLIELWLPNNKLKSLPSDLFEHNAKIERISFSNNKLEIISVDIFNPLSNLKFANFKRNSKIDAVFDIEVNNSATLEELKEMIRVNCRAVTKVDQKIQTMEITFENDLNRFLFNENFKDFDIKGENRCFKVHKFIMAARSPIVCDMLANNPSLKGIALTNTSDDVIEMILDYIYDDEMPLIDNFNENLKIYDVSMKMKLLELAEHCACIVRKKIDTIKAVDVLEIASNHNDSEMMSVAFDVIKEIFPNRRFKENLLSDGRQVAKLINELKNYWRAIDEAAGKFGNLKFFEDESSVSDFTREMNKERAMHEAAKRNALSSVVQSTQESSDFSLPMPMMNSFRLNNHRHHAVIGVSSFIANTSFSSIDSPTSGDLKNIFTESMNNLLGSSFETNENAMKSSFDEINTIRYSVSRKIQNRVKRSNDTNPFSDSVDDAMRNVEVKRGNYLERKSSEYVGDENEVDGDKIGFNI